MGKWKIENTHNTNKTSVVSSLLSTLTKNRLSSSLLTNHNSQPLNKQIASFCHGASFWVSAVTLAVAAGAVF